MADQTRSIPDICGGIGGIDGSSLYPYLPDDRTLRESPRRLLAA